MQHTSEQHDAIHIQDKNLLVVAGAGSGKTRVLVERYVQLLADNPDWPIGALVAITFTRAAAFEMRQRLREELEQRAGAGGWRALGTPPGADGQRAHRHHTRALRRHIARQRGASRRRSQVRGAG